jgi:hypothetical protein
MNPSMELSYCSEPFMEQFEPINHNTSVHTWVYIGTIPAIKFPGMVMDKYQNFVTGQWEYRNMRKEEIPK